MSLGLVWSFERDATWQKEIDGKLAIWAPEIHYMKGTFWLAYCANTGGTGLLRSTTGLASGPYEDIKPDGPLTDQIDASLFEDLDGSVYFLYQNGKIVRMNDDMTALVEEPRLLAPETGQVGFEGAFLFRVGDRYVLSCAEFIEGEYHGYTSTATSLDGPWSPRQLSIPHGGHGMYFRDTEGQWWATLFGNDRYAPFLERPAMLPVEFSLEGNPRPARD